MSDYTIPAGATIGHVHLKVSDLDRAVAFYRDVLGFAAAGSGTASGGVPRRPAATTTTSA